MSRKRKDDAEWAEAKVRCRLNADDVRKAQRLGMSPRGLIKNIPSPSQSWKLPVREWVRELYAKRFGSAEADGSRAGSKSPAGSTPGLRIATERDDDPLFEDDSEFQVNAHPLGSLERPLHRELGVSDAGELIEVAQRENWSEDPLEVAGIEFDRWEDARPLTKRDISEEDERMLRRQGEFRMAAEAVAAEFGKLPFVRKVMLIGSVAAPLKREVPRFRKFRRERVAVWHECGDVDLAVWVDDLSRLKQLQKARARALNDAQHTREVFVAHHQVEVFLLEAGTDRYHGRLCCFGDCPKDKPECKVAGCGSAKFLQQFEGFRFRPQSLAPDRAILLYEVDGNAKPEDRSTLETLDADETAPF